MIAFRYSVPPEWYEGVYQDVKMPCKAGRSFSLVHDEKTDRAVLLLHGYAGYPGELVRPGRDLFSAGFDVFVPRLPGCGTSGDDFSKVHRRDWTRVAENALHDLKGRYRTVYLLGHSMGAAAAVVAASVEPVDRIVLAAPAIAYPGMKPPKPFSQMLLFSLFRKRIPTPWHHQSEFVMYYEDAPADDEYLGAQYWSWVYIRQLYELYKLMYEASDALKNIDSDILTISCGKDQIVGDKSSLYVMETGKGQREHLHLPECTHFFFYDPDKKGEEKGVKAVVDFLAR